MRMPSAVRFAFGVLALALSVAVCTLAVVDHLVLRSLPYDDPDRLVDILRPGRAAGTFAPLSPGLFSDIASGTTSLKAVGAVRPVAPTRVLGREADASQHLVTRQVSPELLLLLGVRPALGRVFTEADLADDAPPVAIITAASWLKRWGRDPDVLGSTIASEGGPITIIGVLSNGIRYPIATDAAVELLMPLKLSARQKTSRGVSYLTVVGRIRDGVTRESVKSDLSRFGELLVVPLEDRARGSMGARLTLLLLAVGLLVTIALTSVAVALVVWARRRLPDFAVRAALGADLRWIAVSVFTEGLVLVLAATALSLLVGQLLLQFIATGLPVEFGNMADVRVDRRVVFLAGSVALAFGALLGLVPLGLVRKANGALQGRPFTPASGERRGLSLVMVVSSSVLFILIATASIALATLVSLETADLGFDQENVLSATYSLPATAGNTLQMPIDSPARLRAAHLYRQQALAAVRTIPGVLKAAISVGSAPLQRGSSLYSVAPWGGTPLPREQWPDTTFVTSEYFDVLAIQTKRGRTFSADDANLPLPPIVLNETAAIALFGTTDVVGNEIDFQGRSTVVGIVSDVNKLGPEVTPRPALYAMFERFPFALDDGTLFVRSASSPASIWPALSRTVRDQVGLELTTPAQLADLLDEILAGRRFSARVLAIFATAAMGIGCLAVFAAMALIVSGRQHRFAVQIALGASPEQVRMSTLRDALLPTCAGIALGMIVFIQLKGVLSALVFGLSPSDPYLLGVAVGIVLVASALAAWVPAHRASKADPLTLLRS